MQNTGRTKFGVKELTLFKCAKQVTGTGKSKINYEEEKKRIEYRQIEHIIKIIIGGERL